MIQISSSQSKFLFFCIILPCLLPFALGGAPTKEEKEMVKLINSEDNSTWTAGFNKDQDKEKSFTSEKMKSTIVGDDTQFLSSPQHIEKRPLSFDARQHWPNCSDVISYVRHKGACASSWATAAAAVISDRICITSKGVRKAIVSAEDILTCCGEECFINSKNKCSGGYGWRAFKMWKEIGVVSGGNYNSRIGCKPYSATHMYTTNAKKCEQYCNNPGFLKKYEDSKYYARSIYRLRNNETQLEDEIMTLGPVMAYMNLYEDFNAYISGVYQHRIGAHWSNHFVKIIGWGVEKYNADDVKYWLAMNNHGVNWGALGGYFKILKGVNHCNIEDEVRAGTVKVDKRRGWREWVLKVEEEPKNGSHREVPSRLVLFFLFLFYKLLDFL